MSHRTLLFSLFICFNLSYFNCDFYLLALSFFYLFIYFYFFIYVNVLLVFSIAIYFYSSIIPATLTEKRKKMERNGTELFNHRSHSGLGYVGCCF